MSGNPHHLSKLQKAENKWRVKYRSWRKTVCPVLKADVHFTTVGWSHITSNKRSKVEILERLEMLPLAKKLIEESKPTHTKHTRLFDGKPTTYHRLEGSVGGRNVVVLIVKTKIGYTFISNFDPWKQ